MLTGLPTVPAVVVFLVSALVSLGASWQLVIRLERLAGRACPKGCWAWWPRWRRTHRRSPRR
ncbi:MAG: hypothetical protein ABJB47_13025 [Actinomycetota bacterium]